MVEIKNKTARNILRYAIPFLAMPLLIFLGVTVFHEKRYLVISFGIALLALVLFVSGFEKKQIGSRRMVIVAVMAALCVAGRFIPLFKPVTAITVITAVYLGGEAGFFVGSMSALVSNFYFGQGPWTPFQMLAWGLIGLFAGYLSKPLKKSKIFLLIYGVLSGVAYSMLMDVWTVAWYDPTMGSDLYIAAIITAIPHTVLYAISNFIFIFFLAKPFGEKLERVKIKYGV